MSSIYVTEPVTKGKVILHTTVGPLDVELWPREAPKACRNFVQLCLEGYYNGTIFHRIVKDFIAQGGDPTGTGSGGESIYDGPFADEFHSRLRFSHRGLIACASFERDKNGSQFFFTLDKTPELDKKNTIFGKIVGDTIYNLIKLNEVEIGPNDRPVYPPKVISTLIHFNNGPKKRAEVVWNPFDDIVPRVLDRPKPMVDVEATQKQKRESKARAIKSKKLLSFGDNEEEEEENSEGDAAAAPPMRMISLVDVMEEERAKRAPKSSHSNKRRKLNDEDNEDEKETGKAAERRQRNDEDVSAEDEGESGDEKKKRKARRASPAPAPESSEDEDSEDEKAHKRAEEQKQLAKKLHLSGASSSKSSFLEQQKQKFGGALSKEEKEMLALAKLQKFQAAGAATKPKDDWRSQPLKFAKEDEEQLKKRLEAEADTLLVIDEREAEREKSRHHHDDYMNDHTRKLRATKNTERW